MGRRRFVSLFAGDGLPTGQVVGAEDRNRSPNRRVIAGRIRDDRRKWLRASDGLAQGADALEGGVVGELIAPRQGHDVVVQLVKTSRQ